MRLTSSLAVLALVLASFACGSEAAVHSNKFVTSQSLQQVEADLGPNAVVVLPVDTSDDPDDVSCSINNLSFSNCTLTQEQPVELHVQTTLCELKPDQPTDGRFFVECRSPGAGIVPAKEIPHCPGHNGMF